MTKKYTQKRLIKYLINYKKVCGKIPTKLELDNNKKYPNSRTYCRYFGTWNKALRKSFDIYRHKWANEKYDDSFLISKLKELSQKLGRTPLSRDLKGRTNSLPSLSVYEKHFGKWNVALKKAGFKPRIKNYSEKELKRFLIEVSLKEGRTPKIDDFRRNNNLPSEWVYQNRYGSWNKALLHFKFKIGKTSHYWTKEKLIDICIKIIDKYGYISEDILHLNKEYPTRSTIARIFGSLENLYKLIGKDRKCEICGFNLTVDCHHIDYDKNNRTNKKEKINTKDNLIWLCPNHHQLIHRLGYSLSDLKNLNRK